MSNTLKNKIALVTGARSPRGIGYASARQLAKAGADVAIADIFNSADADSFTEFHALGKSIAEEFGVRCITISMDITDRLQVEQGIANIVTKLGGLDILFNNAGICFGELFMDMSLEQLNKAWNINVVGAFHTTQVAVKEMLKRGGGSIINNASVAGIGCESHISAYSMSKHAVVAMTKTLAIELGEQNIRVNAVCPGMVLTEMCDVECGIIADAESITVEAAHDLLASRNALKRGCKPHGNW
ncbi:SDR family NAD(P)-dependent oxidoreductase [Vibrio inusitatus]|nr:SDR family oxidoreductase [Vibrio inusitatus]